MEVFAVALLLAFAQEIPPREGVVNQAFAETVLVHVGEQLAATEGLQLDAQLLEGLAELVDRMTCRHHREVLLDRFEQEVLGGWHGSVFRGRSAREGLDRVEHRPDELALLDRRRQILFAELGGFRPPLPAVKPPVSPARSGLPTPTL